MNIFEIQQSNVDRNFLKENLTLEFESAIDVAEVAANLPYLGSLFKIGKVAINMMNWRFTKKIGLFLQQSEGLSEDQISQYIDSLSKKDKDRISDYLVHLLYCAEEDSKAILMGKIYKGRILNMIDDGMMLRLCSIVQKSYLPDLMLLSSFKSGDKIHDYKTDNLFSLGLLSVNTGDIENNVLKIGTSYCLNVIGDLLLNIINLN